jgi:hypothetical protein
MLENLFTHNLALHTLNKYTSDAAALKEQEDDRAVGTIYIPGEY